MEIITIVVLVIEEHVSGGIILDENEQSGEGEHLGEGEHHGDIGHLNRIDDFCDCERIS